MSNHLSNEKIKRRSIRITLKIMMKKRSVKAGSKEETQDSKLVSTK
ncbi:hypothetical protein [Candidatus Liberibacter americanus]|nr:hypothetical protein [Candidatus Liberibacter americanus]